MSLRLVFSLINRYGADRVLQQADGTGGVTVPMTMRRADEAALMGDVSQYDVQFYVEHDRLQSAGFATPPRKGNRVISGNQVWTIKAVEPLHDGVGNPGAYRMWARGH